VKADGAQAAAADGFDELTSGARRQGPGHEEPDADADEHGRDGIPPYHVRHIRGDPAKALLVQITAPLLERVGHR